MNKRIKIGVLGCANIASRWVIPSILELTEHFKLTGISSRDINKAESFAAKYSTDAYSGYDELINGNNIDAVYIPLPNALHAEWIDKSLENRIHVLSEKSLACNKHHVDTLNKKASDNQLVLVENFQFRFHSQLKKIIEILKSGRIGEIRCIKSYFGFPPFKDKNNIRYQKKLGGGALLDAGAYVLKISQILMGFDLEVMAAKLNYDKKNGVDIWGGGFIQQKNGLQFSEVAFGFEHFYQCCLEIWGSEGSLSTNRIFTAPPGYEPEILVESANHKEVIKCSGDNHFKNMLRHFYSLITDKNNIEEEYEQNINQARLIDEFKKKANS